MKRALLQALLLSGGFALTTAMLGWLAVPGMAFIWGMARRHDRRPALVAMVAAGLGWAWLIVWNVAVGRGEVSELMTRAAGAFALPEVGFVALTLAFATLLAWGAATIGRVVRVRGRHESGATEGQKTADKSRPRRVMLRGEVEVNGRTWHVREEIRQGDRPQIFILTAADSDTSEMHIRPIPGIELTTIEEVLDVAADPITRSFVDQGGVRWESRMVVNSGETGDAELIKLYSYQDAEVFEQAYPFSDGLGLRTDEELLGLLDKAR